MDSMRTVSADPDVRTGIWSFLDTLIGRKIDVWDIITTVSLIIPILSVLNPDIDDTFALMSTLFILLANRALHPYNEELYRDHDESSFPTYDVTMHDTGNAVMNQYLGQLRKKLVFDGYTTDQIERAITLNSNDVSRSIVEATNTAVKGTVLNIMQNNLSTSGSYFTSPYTGKKYAFIFGSVDDLLLEFVRDDYQQILKDSLPAIISILKLNSAA